MQSGGTRDRGVNIVSVPTKSGRLATMIPVEGIEGKRERALPQGYRVIANKLFPTPNPSSTKTISVSEIQSRRCDLLESRLKDMDTALSSLTPDDIRRLEQNHEQLIDIKGKISGINGKLLYLSSEESGTLSLMIASLEKRLFECSLRHKELSYSSYTPALPTHSDPK